MQSVDKVVTRATEEQDTQDTQDRIQRHERRGNQMNIATHAAKKELSHRLMYNFIDGFQVLMLDQLQMFRL